MELTSPLILMQWLIKHTYILNPGNTKEPITNTTIKNIFFKEFPETRPELNKEINLLIGSFLKYIYGNELIKSGSNPINYNIGVVKYPVKDIFIRDYKSVYNFDYYTHQNKYNFANSNETYKTLNKFFKEKPYKPLTPKQFIKVDNLSKDIILYCLNKGIPKKYLKYFLFYVMSFINPRDLNLLLTRCKQNYKKNKVCAICGTSNDLTIHHIKEVSKAPYMEFNNNNFIVLCKECHRKHHQKQDKRQSHHQRQKELNEVLQYANL